MLNLTFSGTQVLLGIAMLVFLLCCVGIWGRWFFRHSPGAALSDPGSRTKYRSVDVFRYQPVFLRLGLICSLAFTLLAFNWTQSETRTLSDQVSLAEWEEIDQAPPNFRAFSWPFDILPKGQLTFSVSIVLRA